MVSKKKDIDITEEAFKFVAKTLLEIIEDEELQKNEIISTLKLWLKSPIKRK